MNNEEPNSFNSDLKELFNNFEVNVEPIAFEQVMQKRAQRKRKLRVIPWIFSAAVLVAFTYVFFPSKTPLHSTSSTTDISITALPKTTSTKQTYSAVLDSQHSHITGASPLNKQVIPKPINALMLTNTEKKSAVNSYGKQINYSFHTSTITKQAPLTWYKNLTISKVQRNTAWSLPKVSDSINQIPSSTKGKFSTLPPTLYMHTAWYPISSVENDNASLRNHWADSFGLSAQAHPVISSELGVIFNLSLQFKLGLGIGYRKLSFDKIRTARVPVDSTVTELTSIDKPKPNDWNTAEIALHYIDIPLFVQWQKNTAINWQPFVRAGLTYSHLLQYKAYQFRQQQSGEVHYSEIKGDDNNYLNQHRVSLFTAVGYTYRVTPLLKLSGALQVEKALSTIYENGNSNQIGHFIGIQFGIQLNLNKQAAF